MLGGAWRKVEGEMAVDVIIFNCIHVYGLLKGTIKKKPVKK